MSRDNDSRTARTSFSRFNIEALTVEPENWQLFKEELSTVFGNCPAVPEGNTFLNDGGSCYNIGLDWCMCGEGQYL